MHEYVAKFTDMATRLNRGLTSATSVFEEKFRRNLVSMALVIGLKDFVSSEALAQRKVLPRVGSYKSRPLVSTILLRVLIAECREIHLYFQDAVLHCHSLKDFKLCFYCCLAFRSGKV